MADSPILEALAQQRARLEANDTASMRRLIEAYSRMQRRLQGQIDALLFKIENDIALSGQETTRGRLVRMQRYKDLIAQVEQEMNAISGLLRAEVDAVAEFGITFGENGARELMGISVGDAGLAPRFNRLPVDTIETLLGFLGPESPLFARIQALSGVQAQRIADAILEGIALGFNSRKTAAAISQAFGLGLTDALRMVRTVQNWAYREASRATYIANGDIVESWIWFAQLGDTRTCMSCVAQHGKEYPLSQPLNDHHNGRCAMIPKITGFPNPVDETGQGWFEQLSEEQQRNFMGKARFEAWKSGSFDFDDLSREVDNDVYGPMRSETPLKVLTK